MADAVVANTAGISGTVLVVDDMDMVLGIVRILLEKFGCRVATANSAKDGLLILEEQPIDLIVTDVMMPECDGIAFLREVRQRTTDVPVVLMTGSAHLAMAIEAIKNGAFDLITKPLDAEHFRNIVKKALEHRRLLLMERNYQSDLERTVSEQTLQLREALLELDKFHEYEKSTAQERSQFLTTLTHELRTPMNGIVAPLSMLRAAELSDDDRELVEIAAESAGRMTKLVDQLLSFAQSSKKRDSAKKECFDLRVLLSSLAKVHAPGFTAKGITLTVSVDEAVPAHVLGDWELTCKVAEIFLSNALKFTRSGTTALSISLIRDADAAPNLHLQVSDSGIGIVRDKLERVFDPFFQVDGGLTRREGGLGLGLSQARQIVEHLGGRIWAESEPGSGSTFHADLPFHGC